MIKIKAGKQLIALIIRNNEPLNGFIADQANPLQLGFLSFVKNHQVRPHEHRCLTKTVHKNQEFIYVVSGQLEVSFFNKGQTFVKQRLETGDCLLQIRGGHGFRFLQPTKIITVKQGPYRGKEREKKLLRTASLQPSS
jgi:mannose-6-phosphate isomerase-like protein (cupin superfamily)